ncbi:GNAT family N-acetyltransferase [Streptomyces tritici]|uniref:GNAT family N-acetyltransferase n=1 Tax=Streptomyces tritici TaxID=2054410 RepID=UPI003AF0555A
MTWFVSEDVDAFLDAAGPGLAGEAVRGTVVWTVAESVRRQGPYAFGDVAPARFGWWREGDGGAVTGTFVVTPPHPPALGPMTEAAARALADEPAVSDATAVRGETAAVRAFADARGGDWAVARETRLFRLGALTPPEPAPAGRARVADPADVPLLAAWFAGFAAETGEGDPAADWTPAVTTRVAEGRLTLWETPDAGAVALAGLSQQVAGQTRVSPVFTPREHRGRGYAGAVTSAVSAAARAAGAREVLLFADLANPTSNALYQRLGYRPVTDHLALTRT